MTMLLLAASESAGVVGAAAPTGTTLPLAAAAAGEGRSGDTKCGDRSAAAAGVAAFRVGMAAPVALPRRAAPVADDDASAAAAGDRVALVGRALMGVFRCTAEAGGVECTRTACRGDLIAAAAPVAGARGDDSLPEKSSAAAPGFSPAAAGWRLAAGDAAGLLDDADGDDDGCAAAGGDDDGCSCCCGFCGGGR